MVAPAAESRPNPLSLFFRPFTLGGLPEHPAQLRAIRAWCLAHLTGVTALASLSAVVWIPQRHPGATTASRNSPLVLGVSVVSDAVDALAKTSDAVVVTQDQQSISLSKDR